MGIVDEVGGTKTLAILTCSLQILVIIFLCITVLSTERLLFHRVKILLQDESPQSSISVVTLNRAPAPGLPLAHHPQSAKSPANSGTAAQTSPRVLALHQYCVRACHRCWHRESLVHRVLRETQSCRRPTAPSREGHTQPGHPTLMLPGFGAHICSKTKEAYFRSSECSMLMSWPRTLTPAGVLSGPRATAFGRC